MKQKRREFNERQNRFVPETDAKGVESEVTYGAKTVEPHLNAKAGPSGAQMGIKLKKAPTNKRIGRLNRLRQRPWA